MEQINPINKVTLKDKMKSYTRHPGSLILLLLVLIAAALTVVTLLFLVGYILISGIPYLKPSLFALHYNSDNVSMLPAIINTVEMVLVSLLFSVPFGVGAAIYMIEYARKGNKFVEVVRLTAETLTGIPSIIYGLFGMLFLKCSRMNGTSTTSPKNPYTIDGMPASRFTTGFKSLYSPSGQNLAIKTDVSTPTGTPMISAPPVT